MYFVTICARDGRCLFGRILGDVVVLYLDRPHCTGGLGAVPDLHASYGRCFRRHAQPCARDRGSGGNERPDVPIDGHRALQEPCEPPRGVSDLAAQLPRPGDQTMKKSSPPSATTSRRIRCGGLWIERTRSVSARRPGRSGTGPYSLDGEPVVWTEARRCSPSCGHRHVRSVGAGPRPARAGLGRSRVAGGPKGGGPSCGHRRVRSVGAGPRPARGGVRAVPDGRRSEGWWPVVWSSACSVRWGPALDRPAWVGGRSTCSRPRDSRPQWDGCAGPVGDRPRRS